MVLYTLLVANAWVSFAIGQAFQKPLEPSLENFPFQNVDSSIDSIASACYGYSFPEVVCMKRYGSYIKGDFDRPIKNIIGHGDKYGDVHAEKDTAFDYVSNASFLIWDERGKDVLGPSPLLEYMQDLPEQHHEGPLWLPETNELVFTRIEHQNLAHGVIDLSKEPPTFGERVWDPPLYAPTGARYYKGLAYFSTLGGNSSLGGHNYQPSIVVLNVTTGKSKVLLNNYYGYNFNGIDDMDIDGEGNIWFSDNFYSRPAHVNTKAPQIPTGTYKFVPSTGHVQLMDDTIREPNGVQFSMDHRILFVGDTGAAEGNRDPSVASVPQIKLNSTGPRTIYAFDVVTRAATSGRGTASYLINKRPIWRSHEYLPDGLKISREGYLLAAEGHGITILDTDGAPVARVQTNYTAVNMAWAGPDYDELWIVGYGGSSRLRLGIKGPKPS